MSKNQSRPPTKHDPFYGNLDDLYHEEFEAMGIFDEEKSQKLRAKPQDLYNREIIHTDELSDSQEDTFHDFTHSLQVLRTPLTKILKDKVKCIESFDTIQGALDYNTHLIKNLQSDKTLNHEQYVYVMRLLELNLKKLASIADESMALREYVPLEGGEYQARVKGILNETRAMKYAYSDAKIRDSYFSTPSNDYIKLYQSIEQIEIKMPNIRKRKFNQAFGHFVNEPESRVRQDQKFSGSIIFKTTQGSYKDAPQKLIEGNIRSKRIQNKQESKRMEQQKKYVQIFIRAIMDPEYGQTQEFLKQFPDNKNVEQSLTDDGLDFDVIINMQGLKQKNQLAVEESEDDLNILQKEEPEPKAVTDNEPLKVEVEGNIQEEVDLIDAKSLAQGDCEQKSNQIQESPLQNEQIDQKQFDMLDQEQEKSHDVGSIHTSSEKHNSPNSEGANKEIEFVEIQEDQKDEELDETVKEGKEVQKDEDHKNE